MVQEAIDRTGGFGGGPLPNHIWLCGAGIGGSELTLAGAQPPDASFFMPDVPDKAAIHSHAAWSPDGSRLAWTTLDYPEDTHGSRSTT
jgi:hypothetical protein